MSERYFEMAPGRRLRYLTNGNAGRPRLLMLHGVNTRADYFAEFFPFIGVGFEIFAPDFRGHGGSFRSDEPYSLAAYAEDIGVFIESAIEAPLAIVGMSLGGRIALLLADRYPQKVSRAVVIDVGPDVDPAGLERIVRTQAQLPQSFASLDALEAFYREAYRSVSPHYIERIIRHGWKQLPDGQLVTSYDRNIWRADGQVFAADAAMLNAVVGRLSLPVLVIRGGQSDILTADAARAFVARLGNGRLVEIPGATHGVVLEEPARCAELIGEFLREPD